MFEREREYLELVTSVKRARERVVPMTSNVFITANKRYNIVIYMKGQGFSRIHNDRSWVFNS